MWLHLRCTGFCNQQESTTCVTFSTLTAKSSFFRQSSNSQTSLSKQRSNTLYGPFFFDNNPADNLTVNKDEFSFAVYEDYHVTICLYRTRLTQVGQSRTPIVVVFKREVKLGLGGHRQVQFKCHLLQPATDLPDLVNP